jgi:hypothetical protein
VTSKYGRNKGSQGDSKVRRKEARGERKFTTEERKRERNKGRKE